MSWKAEDEEAAEGVCASTDWDRRRGVDLKGLLQSQIHYLLIDINKTEKSSKRSSTYHLTVVLANHHGEASPGDATIHHARVKE